MSLKRRIARLERDVEWLWWWGRLRGVELRMDIIDAQKAMAKARAAAVPVKPVVSAGPRPSPPPPPPAKPPDKLAPHPESSPEPPPEPLVQPYDPPEDMQIRPVRWRQRGLEDYDDDRYGTVLVDYDPLADDDDDDDDDDDEDDE